MSAADDIAGYIGLLSSNRALIAEAYCNGGVQRTDDNKAAIQRLQNARVLKPKIHGEFRLNTSLKRHLDDYSQRQRRYEIGANYTDQIDRLKILIEGFTNASSEGRIAEIDEYETDFDEAVFELAEQLSNDLLGLRAVAENKFADVRTVAEKQRQNEFYLTRTERVQSVIETLAGDAITGLLDDSPMLTSLHTSYQQQVLALVTGWRSTCLEVTDILKKFLFSFRDIDAAAGRIRTFAYFMRSNPDWIPPDEEGLRVLPEWALRIPGSRIKSLPDLSCPQTRTALVDIALSIPASTPIATPSGRTAGILQPDGPAQDVHLEVPPARAAFERFYRVAMASGIPISALAWKRQHAEFSAIEDAGWLIYLLDAAQSKIVRGAKRLQVRREEGPAAYSLSGNITIKDVHLWTKA